jgi:dipeptidyl aminopeptidase/acylaminoacyl peptidase
MSNPKVAPYGSWKSPITSDLIVSETIMLDQIALAGEDVYWGEVRPSEGGRYVIVRRSPDGETSDVTPSPFNARTQAHEYGGGSYVIADGVAYFSNWDDQRLYRQEISNPDQPPRPITPDTALRYADGVVDHRQGRMICVREDHTDPEREAVNTLVALDLDPDEGDFEAQVLVSGNDFYAAPRLNPDGSRLAWLTWDHPNMPWDGTELWVAEMQPDGSLRAAERVAGGSNESIFQPEWSPEGVLYFVSDRSGWWNLYRRREGSLEPVVEMEAEFGKPQWVFNMSTYTFESPERIICSYTQDGLWRLAQIDLETGQLSPIETPYTEIHQVRAADGRVVFRGGLPTEPTAIVQLNLKTGQFEKLRSASRINVEPGYLSVPQEIEFPTTGSSEDLTAHAFFYPPENKDYVAPEGEHPPLVVISHGGPTGAAPSSLSLTVQYFTSRGFAVLDVNYGGSSGYGRLYRQRLEGQWGVVDVEDCINGARYLIDRGDVDGERLIIRGGSAGGYTTLCALAFRDVFEAGASYFGLSELEVFARDTHKFESRYLERLIGPYPEKKELYRERSPINSVDQLSCPVIFFQGLEDKIVPPNQAELMVEVLQEKGLPVAYIPFEGEQHGFRRAENIKRSLDAELYFYSRVFGFELAEDVEPVEIDNL